MFLIAPPPVGRPDRTLLSAGLVLAASFLWIIILPGAVAFHNKTFYSVDIANRLIASKTSPSAAISGDQANKLALTNELRQLNEQISTLIGQANVALQIKSLIEARDKIQQDLKSFRPKIAVMGFHDDPVNVVFLLNYLALLCSVFIMPSGKHRIQVRRTVVIGFAVYVVFTWPNFLRNFIFDQYYGDGYERGRTVFAYPRWDIDHVGFVLQEARVFVMIFLLSVLWHRWSVYATEVDANTQGWSSHLIEVDKFAGRAVAVSEQVSRWQGHSLLLTVTFLPWTWFFGPR
jgi:hypothetical protein